MKAIQNFSSPFTLKTVEQRRKKFTASPALPETAVSVVLAATVVGAAAIVLVRRTRGSKEIDTSVKTCEDCGGSGICAECKGEGFVLKKLSEESAEKARLAAKNMYSSIFHAPSFHPYHPELVQPQEEHLQQEFNLDSNYYTPQFACFKFGQQHAAIV
ncbi:uncharacterized protein LOC122073387 [Macadamia integrifolia]|uniref:uncharacterized protein LOC122073387 n=1 Tax=Macadamia integrifolia TaxID=60698 RepID=UPI001C4E84F3|nr:uncharacterized protein LOC122073387 [Macadamia integrifolia]